MPGISQNPAIAGVVLSEQSSAPAVPSSGKRKLYVGTDGGLRLEDSAGNVSVIASAVVAGANLLVNPGLDVWQRGGGAFTATNAYTADRWQIVLGSSSTISVSRNTADVDTGSQYCAAATYTHTNQSRLTQAMEDYGQLRGRTVTFSVRVKTTTASAARPYAWDSVNGYRYGSYHPGGAGTYATLSITAAISATATGVQVGVALEASCTAYVDNATLVAGSTGLDYVPLHPADDLLRCQRYYELLGGTINDLLVSGQCYATTNAQFPIRWRVPKAIVPTVTINSPTSFQVANAGGAGVACTGLISGSAGVTTRDGAALTATVASGLVAGNGTVIFPVSTAATVVAEANP